MHQHLGKGGGRGHIVHHRRRGCASVVQWRKGFVALLTSCVPAQARAYCISVHAGKSMLVAKPTGVGAPKITYQISNLTVSPDARRVVCDMNAAPMVDLGAGVELPTHIPQHQARFAHTLRPLQTGCQMPFKPYPALGTGSQQCVFCSAACSYAPGNERRPKSAHRVAEKYQLHAWHAAGRLIPRHNAAQVALGL